jgi:hypothetical protein
VYFERRKIYVTNRYIYNTVYMTALNFEESINFKECIYLSVEKRKRNRKNKNVGITENCITLYTYWARLFFMRTLNILSSEMDPAEVRFN